MTKDISRIDADIVCVGGGLAGLYAVCHLPDGLDVVVLDKGQHSRAGSSHLAQGGLAAAMGPDDSVEAHIADTVAVGASLVNEDAAEILASEAPREVTTLIAMGAVFDAQPSGELHLHREAGQTFARSVHNADATGRELMRVVVAQARKLARRIVGTAVQLVTYEGQVCGVLADTADGFVEVRAKAVLLSTGGCGALFKTTTNDAASTGDAIALGYGCGASVADLEMIQFHPTVLNLGKDSSGSQLLLTEALRGDGAFLVDESGFRFMPTLHDAADLAPRDVVAREIHSRGGAWLDISRVANFDSRYPNIAASLRGSNVDYRGGPIPVYPAAHYHLGGVETDTDGRSSVPCLYAAGECACTGVHGANRMAGNSLAEAVVFGRRAAKSIAEDIDGGSIKQISPSDLPPGLSDRSEENGSALAAVREIMSEHVGVMRSEQGLSDAISKLASLGGGSHVTAAELICLAALERRESRGVHFRSDYPERTSDFDGVSLQVTGRNRVLSRRIRN